MSRLAQPKAGWIIGAVVGAVAVGSGVLVAFGSGDEPTDAAPPSTERPGVIGDTDLLPLPATTVRPPDVPQGPEATSSQQWSLFDDDVGDIALPSSDASVAQLRNALDKLTIEAPLRITTDVEIGDQGYELRVVASTESDARRVLFTLGTSQSATAGFLVDLDTVTTVMGQSGQDGTQIDNDELATGLGAENITTLLRQLLLGPIRDDTIEFAERISTGPIVNLGDGPNPYGRQFIVEMPAGAARSWAPYRLAPGEEAPPLSDSTPIRFSVYLSAQEQIVRVTADVPYGSTVQRIDHRLDWRPSEEAWSGNWLSSPSARPR